MDKKSEFLNAFRSIIMNSNSRWGGGASSLKSQPALQGHYRLARIAAGSEGMYFCCYFYKGALKVEIEMMKASRNEK